MTEWTDAEVSMLDDMCGQMFDAIAHQPDEYTEDEVLTHGLLCKRVRDEAKRRKFQWAR